MTTSDLSAAKAVIDIAHGVVDRAARGLAAAGNLDDHQVIAYDLAHAAATVDTGRAMLSYGEKGELEGELTCAYVADAVAELATKLFGREALWGVAPDALDETRSFVSTYRDPVFLATLAQRWRMELEPGQVVEPRPRMTLRPKDAVRMRVREMVAG